MKYLLMHRETVVLELDMDPESGYIRKTGKLHAPEHLPVGIPIHRGTADQAAVNTWWLSRSIPASRTGLREALAVLQLPESGALLSRSLGFSLSDQYWIKPEHSAFAWKDMNYFTHPFSEEIGDILLGSKKRPLVLDFHSPDITSEGNLQKRWKILNGRRCLLKGGSRPFFQQPLNEVIVSRIMDRLSIPHVTYQVIWDRTQPFSVCEDFITPETELVTAWRILQTQKKENSISWYQHYVNCCLALGIKDVVHALDQMLVTDYLIANEDRHLNNFGMVRSAETLAWLGAAPIYDSGSSLGYDSLTSQITPNQDVPCKPFKMHHRNQILLVRDYSWIDFERLAGLEEEIRSILTAGNASDYIDSARVSAITHSVAGRIDNLKRLALSASDPTQIRDNVLEDLEEDTAAEYLTIE